MIFLIIIKKIFFLLLVRHEDFLDNLGTLDDIFIANLQMEKK